MTENFDRLTLIELIEAYGAECTAGGQGYTVTCEIELFEEIKNRLASMGVE